MKGILLTSRSLTFAQKMKAILNSSGIMANIVRPDIEITQKSCAYAVMIQESFLPEAIDILSQKGIVPVSAFLISDDGYEEIRI